MFLMGVLYYRDPGTGEYKPLGGSGDGGQDEVWIDPAPPLTPVDLWFDTDEEGAPPYDWTDADNRYVNMTGNETVAGVKTFSSSPVLPGNAAAALESVPLQQVQSLLAALIPTGSIMIWAGASAPAGWQLCNGTLLSRTTHSALFAVIGVTYGIGDGVTTFASPNIQGRMVLGTGGGYSLNATGGAATHTLTTAEMPAHTHDNINLTDGRRAIGGSSSTTFVAGAGMWAPLDGVAMVMQSAGGGQAHNNMPPYIVLNYIIKL